MESHLLCLGFNTGNLHPVPAAMALAGRTPPCMILRLPSAAWDCHSPFCASRWVEGEWIHKSVFPCWGGMWHADRQKNTVVFPYSFSQHPDSLQNDSITWEIKCAMMEYFASFLALICSLSNASAKYQGNSVKKKKKKKSQLWTGLYLLSFIEIIHLSGCHFGLRWVAEALVHLCPEDSKVYSFGWHWNALVCDVKVSFVFNFVFRLLFTSLPQLI